jgi:hypothetical protein
MSNEPARPDFFFRAVFRRVGRAAEESFFDVGVQVEPPLHYRKAAAAEYSLLL